MYVTRWLGGIAISIAFWSHDVSAQPAAGAPAPPPVRRVPPQSKRAPVAAKRPPVRVDLAPMVAALGGPNVEAAAKAATDLGAIADAAAHEALLDALAFGLPPAVAVPALDAVAQRPVRGDVPSLSRYANHRNPTVRGAALVVLAKYAEPDARNRIVRGLHDPANAVRAAAATAVAKAKIVAAAPSLLQLLAKGEEPAVQALGAIADPDLARKIADQLGKVPEPSLARTLGAILKRPDIPEPTRIELVRAIAKIQDRAAVDVLLDYVATSPKRQSRDEAETVVTTRGGK